MWGILYYPSFAEPHARQSASQGITDHSSVGRVLSPAPPHLPRTVRRGNLHKLETAVAIVALGILNNSVAREIAFPPYTCSLTLVHCVPYHHSCGVRSRRVRTTPRVTTDLPPRFSTTSRRRGPSAGWVRPSKHRVRGETQSRLGTAPNLWTVEIDGTVTLHCCRCVGSRD